MAKKNEAQIKFSAQTKDFNNSINEANGSLKGLRSELKLNSAQMVNAGDKTNLLEERHQILQKELEASQKKTNALTDKIKVATDTWGENSDEVKKLQIELNNARTIETKIERDVASCNAEIKNQVKANNEAATSFDRLEKTISGQEDELKDLKKQYANVVLEQGEASNEARDLASNISSLSGELNENKTKLNNSKKAADKLGSSLDDADDEAGDTQGYTMMKDVLSDLASTAITSIISGIGNMITSLGDLSEATKDYRTEQGKMNASVEDSGYTSDLAKEAYKELYGFMGDSTSASTAVSNMSAIHLSQENLMSLTKSMQGVWAKYGDSIPIDGLAESVNETIKVGKVTGNLADALNWAGVNEDDFNEKLEACSTEQERQQLVVDTLSDKYDDLATSYEENNKSIVEANEANANYEAAMASLGETVEPVTSIITDLKANALEKIKPVIASVADTIQEMNTWMEENQTAATVMKGILLGLAVGFGILAVALGITNLINLFQKAFALLNLTMSLNPIVLIIAAIAALVVAFLYLWNNCDAFREFFINAWETIKAAVMTVVSAIAGYFVEKWENIKETWAVAVSFFTGVKDGIKNAFKSIPEWFGNVFANAWQKVKNVFSKGGKVFSGIKDGILSGLKAVINALIKGINTVVSLPFKGINKAFNKLRNISILGKSPFSWIPTIKAPQIPYMKEGGILNRATLNVAGEAGPEAIVPIDKLMGYITTAINSASQMSMLQGLISAIQSLADRKIYLNINGRSFAEATASDSDGVNGRRLNLRERGLAQ